MSLFSVIFYSSMLLLVITIVLDILKDRGWVAPKTTPSFVLWILTAHLFQHLMGWV